MKRALFAALPALALVTCVALADEAKPDADGWVELFDGKTLTGWKASEKPENWTVEEGTITGRGERSHLFYVGSDPDHPQEFENLEFIADVKLNKGGNSGMYFRTAFGPGWPKGYEAQVNNSSGDPVKTGSLYYLKKVFEQHVPDDTWWTQHVICNGNHIVIKVNDKVLVDFVDEDNTYKQGLLALQQHDPGSVVHYKNLKVKKLP